MIRTELRTAEVLSDSFSACRIVPDRSYDQVAVAAQQSSHHPGGVAVIDVEDITIPAPLDGTADGAASALLGQQGVVLLDGDAVPLQVIRPDVIGVGFAPCLVVVPELAFWLTSSPGGGSSPLLEGALPSVATVANQGDALGAPQTEPLLGAFVDVDDAMATTGCVVVPTQELDRFAFTVTKAGVAHLGDAGLAPASAMTVPSGDQAPWGALASVVRIIHEKEDTK